MKRFIIGLLFVLSGFALMYYGPQLVKILGRWNWAESYLGGTRQAYILIGFCLMMIGFMYMFGMLDTGNMTQIDSNMGTSSK